MAVTEVVDRPGQLRELVEAMSVKRDGDQFVVNEPDWWGQRVFGGMVVAQALNAALQTVDRRFDPHSVHGYFMRPLAPLVDARLTVENLRDSRSFALRQVTIGQAGSPSARFTCSFHVPEEGDEYQLPMKEVPGPDSLTKADMPGPFDACDAGPTPPAPDGTYDSSARLWHRTCAPLEDDPVTHYCVLAYCSDMTRTSFRPLSMDTWGTHTDASIDHAVWFHRRARADEWFLSDFQALINTGGRSVVRGTMYTPAGELFMSMAQELLIRPLPGQGGPAPWAVGP